MAAFVFPGSTPPQEAPESIVEETPNPLLDATNGSLRRRRVIAASSRGKSEEDKVRPPTLNLFQNRALPSSNGVLGNQDGSSCWVLFESKEGVADATVQEELSKFDHVVNIRRGAGSNTATTTSWLIQFQSVLFAHRAAAMYPDQLVLLPMAQVEALLLVDRTTTTTTSTPPFGPTRANSTTGPAVVDPPLHGSSKNSVPYIWLHSNDDIVESHEELDEEELPCWKVVLLWLLGVEKRPTRFVGVRG
jgi:hypothetical protein